MRAKLVGKTDYIRFYELSEPVLKGRPGDVDIDCIFKLFYGRLKPYFRDLLEDILLSGNGAHIVCISDARDHIERLMFPALYIPGVGYHPISIDIEGIHTNLSTGGDPRKVHPDEVYLRKLAKDNGLKWDGVD